MLLAALLALTLLAPLGLTASAADGPDTIYIDSASDFVSFAKSCALDTWSAGKTVILRADISWQGWTTRPWPPSAARLTAAAIPSPT
ncbi:MAG: hypothetical protein ACLUFI_13935 [Oscillospiraceae bacterium]